MNEATYKKYEKGTEWHDMLDVLAEKYGRDMHRFKFGIDFRLCTKTEIDEYLLVYRRTVAARTGKIVRADISKHI